MDETHRPRESVGILAFVELPLNTDYEQLHYGT